ncbi:MAG: hypothetical protein CM1200mP2_27210 [Planctomycetaceae bacterium]|nr:MAG: hypothetical protein CM1200mP2_27210 [Planctomycetaceae bacterium]
MGNCCKVFAARWLWLRPALALLLVGGSAWGRSGAAAEVSLVTGGKPRGHDRSFGQADVGGTVGSL